MTEEKERLEKELGFLKESLESGIITEEEYKEKKEIIEKKLNDLEEEKQNISEETKEELEKEEVKDTKERQEEIKIQEIKEEALKEVEEKKRRKIEEKQEDTEKKEKKPEKTKKNIKKEKAEDLKEEIEELQEKEKPAKKKKNKLIIFSILILIIFLIFYFYAFKETNKGKESILELKPACVSDSDCEMQNKIGICLNPNTTEAKCEFKEDKQISLTIINDRDCISCDTTRMFQIIKKLFPSVEKKEIDYNSEEGNKLITQLNIEALPSYIFGSEIVDALNFDKFKRALIKKEDKFIINSAASGSNYYFKRKEIKNRLDLFVLPSTSPNVEDNVQEVLELFGDKINYSIHPVSDEKEEKKLNNELGITTYPSFLVNNQLKFTGIQPSELIKNKFCEFNKLPECETKLSESLK